MSHLNCVPWTYLIASGSKETEGNAHNYLSQLDYFQGYLKRALDHAEASVRCLREIGNPTRLAWALIFQGGLSYVTCKQKKTTGMSWKRQTHGSSGLETIGPGVFFYNINCRNCLKTGQYETALKIALEGLGLAERIGEGILTVFHLAYAGLGALYAVKGDLCLGPPSEGRESRR